MSQLLLRSTKFNYFDFNIELSLGEKIKIYRKRSGLSQLELEMKTYLSPGTISRMENNLINPTKESLVKIVKVLALSNDEILDLFGF